MKQRKTPDDDVREKLIFNYQEMEKEAYERVLAPQLRLRVFVFFSIFHYTYNVHTTYTSWVNITCWTRNKIAPYHA